MSLSKLRLVVRQRSAASSWPSQRYVAVDPHNNYIYTSGTNSAYTTAYLGGWTYSSSTNTLTLRNTATTSGSMSWEGIYGLSANYRGVVLSFMANVYGFKAYTFDGTTLTQKANNTYLVGSPCLDLDISFRVGTNSDDIIVAQNESGGVGRVVSFSWDGSTTVTNGVLKTISGIYARKIHANPTYYVTSGPSTVSTWGEFSTAAISTLGTFGDQNAEPYVSPNINRCYNMLSTTIKMYDLSASVSYIGSLSPGLGGVYSAFEDSNNIVYFSCQYGIAAYTYSSTTYTLRAILSPPDNSIWVRMEGDSLGNLFVLSNNTRLYVVKAQWYQPNPLILGQHI